MKRSRKRTSQVLLWSFSVLVVLSMALGLAVSVLPRPNPPMPTPSPVPYTFAVCGGLLEEDGSSGSLSAYGELLQRVAEDGNYFLIHTGNLVPDGSESSFQAFSELVAGFPLPLYPIAGTRDHHQGTLDNFLRYSGAPDVHYSFDFGLVHFSMVNSDLGELTTAELEWLQSDLESGEQPVKMVFLHVPPFGSDNGVDVLRSGGDEFMALMEHQKVDFVFAGHAPNYSAQDRGGVLYVTTGSLGASLDPDGDGGTAHYIRVDVVGTDVALDLVPLGVGVG